VKALVVSPHLPGAGKRVLEFGPVREFWYIFVTSGRTGQGASYIVDDDRIDHLVKVYSASGAFVASINWYRTSSSNPVTAFATETKPSPAERLATPTTVLWEDQDPIFPYEWSDQLDAFFQNYTLERLSGSGHFTPLEATDRFAEAIKQRLRNGDADRSRPSPAPRAKQKRRSLMGATSSV
jgi:pimeloyl-ACP methyl ester carboxylesterase